MNGSDSIKKTEYSGLSVRGLQIAYHKREVIKNVDFNVRPGETAGLLGANGSGKTTILKALCGILPSEGRIFFDGRDLKTLSVREMAMLAAYIPQRSGITIPVTVLDVVLMAYNARLPLFSGPTRDMIAEAEAALMSVGLADRAHEDFQTLSEGQKQLCLFARTAATGSRLLFLDEPESALDFGERYRMMDRIRAYNRSKNGVALVTLHDPELALRCLDRLILIDDGEVIGEIFPDRDACGTIEMKLSRIFGPLSVHRITDRNGIERLTLVRET